MLSHASRALLQRVSLVLLLSASALAPDAAAQQDSTKVVRIELTDGSVLVGRVTSESPQGLVVRLTSGLILTVPRDDIARIVSGEISAGTVVYSDPNRSRLFFAPTARPVHDGEGYFAVYEVFFPFLAYGIGDVVTLAGGISLIPAAPAQLVYVAPKWTIYQHRDWSVAAGFLGATVVGNLDSDEIPTFALAYGAGTIGDEDTAVSLGVAFGYLDDRWSGKPAVMFGLERRLSDSVKFLSENYWFVGVEEGLIFSGGVRFFGEKLAADIGAVSWVGALGEGGFPLFPWLGFAYNFGR